MFGKRGKGYALQDCHIDSESAFARRTIQPNWRAPRLESARSQGYGFAMRTTRWLLVVMLALVACQRTAKSGQPTSGLTTREFIDLYVALKQAQASTHAPADFEKTKQQLFQKAHAQPESLQRFVQEHAGDVKMMANVWDTIASRLLRTGGEGVSPTR